MKNVYIYKIDLDDRKISLPNLYKNDTSQSQSNYFVINKRSNSKEVNLSIDNSDYLFLRMNKKHGIYYLDRRFYY